VVLEVDAAVLELAKRAFGLRSGPLLRLRVADARVGLADLPPAGQDVVVRDAFAGASVPTHLTTAEFLADVRRVLAPGGLYLANLADDPKLGAARREAATALSTFAHVALMAEPGQLNGRRYGNVVLAASDADLPEAPLVRRLASGAVRARLLDTGQVRAFASGYRPLRDPAVPPGPREPLTPAG
jgi:spermidine synthase